MGCLVQYHPGRVTVRVNPHLNMILSYLPPPPHPPTRTTRFLTNYFVMLSLLSFSSGFPTKILYVVLVSSYIFVKQTVDS
jgi:hypothetical protein